MEQSDNAGTLPARDVANWAQPVAKLTVDGERPGAANLNVEGRGLTGPLQGFGALWQKTYRVPLAGATPQEVVGYWKAHLPELMPSDSRFYPSLTGVQPWEVLLINASMPGLPGGGSIPVYTGVLILYADEETFSVMTPDGHPESGFNTFSAYEEDGTTVAQIQSLARANDPVYEFGFRFLGGDTQQERIWHHVLTELATHFGVEPTIEMKKVCVDGRVQWSQAGNVRYNAVIRTTVSAPGRWAKRVFARGAKA